MERITYDDQTAYFSKQLKELFNNKGLRPKQIAEDINKSVSYIRDVLSGRRLPSLDTLFSICESLNINLEDILKCAINEDWIEMDGGIKAIPTLRFNNSRLTKSESYIFIYEDTFLRNTDLYPGYRTENFLDYVIKFLKESLYNPEYKEYKKQRSLEQSAQSISKRGINTNQKLLNEIIDLLYDMDNLHLSYLKEQILLYQKHEIKLIKKALDQNIRNSE